MASVFDVANFMLDNKPDMTAWQVEKLCYYGKAWGLALLDDGIFPEFFQAWKNGPVCKPLYDKHKGAYNVYKTMFPQTDENALTDERKALLLAVLYKYGGMTGEQLRDKTHAEYPWVEARGDTPEWMNSESLLKDEVMRDYYRSQESDREAIDNNALFYLAKYREGKNHKTISFDEMMDRMGITSEDIEGAEDVEFEVEPLVFK